MSLSGLKYSQIDVASKPRHSKKVALYLPTDAMFGDEVSPSKVHSNLNLGSGNVPLRKGKWTTEEEAYASKIILPVYVCLFIFHSFVRLNFLCSAYNINSINHIFIPHGSEVSRSFSSSSRVFSPG